MQPEGAVPEGCRWYFLITVQAGRALAAPCCRLDERAATERIRPAVKRLRDGCYSDLEGSDSVTGQPKAECCKKLRRQALVLTSLQCRPVHLDWWRKWKKKQNV